MYQSDHIRFADLSLNLTKLFVDLCKRNILDLNKLSAPRVGVWLDMAVYRNQETIVLHIYDILDASKELMRDLDINMRAHGTRRTLLHVAVSNGSESIARRLLNWRSINISVRDNDGKTSFDLAFEGNLPMVDPFLEFGDSNHQNNQLVDSLFYAALRAFQYSSYPMVIELLCRAARDGNDEMVGKILDSSSLVLNGMKEIWQPIREAVQRGHLAIVKRLLSPLDTPSLEDYAVKLGCDPLHQACENGDREMVDFLL